MEGRRRKADGEVCRGVGQEERGGRRAAYLVPSVWEHPVSWDVLEKEAGGGMSGARCFLRYRRDESDGRTWYVCGVER